MYGPSHIGNTDIFKSAPHDVVDAQPVRLDAAVGFEAARPGGRAAFGKPEWLLVQGVDNLSNGNFFCRPAKHITTMRAAHTAHKIVVPQCLQYLADRWQANPQNASQIRCAKIALWVIGHVGEDQRAIINNFTDSQHG